MKPKEFLNDRLDSSIVRILNMEMIEDWVLKILNSMGKLSMDESLYCLLVLRLVNVDLERWCSVVGDCQLSNDLTSDELDSIDSYGKNRVLTDDNELIEDNVEEYAEEMIAKWKIRLKEMLVLIDYVEIFRWLNDQHESMIMNEDDEVDEVEYRK